MKFGKDIGWKEGRVKSYKVEIDGLEVSYKRGGSGKKILFIHGFGLGSWEYDKVVAELGDSYDVLVVDLPGFGGRKPLKNPSAANFSKIVEKLIGHLGWEKCIVCGQSLGGLIAIYLAARSPQLIDKLILSCAVWSGEYIDPALKFLRNDFLFKLAKIKRFWFLVEVGVNLYIKYLPNRDKSKLDRADLEKTISSVLSSDLNTLAFIAHELGHVNVEDRVKGIKAETLVIDAEKARILRYESSQELVKLLPNAMLKVVSDCGHSIQLEKPKEFAKLVKEFVG